MREKICNIAALSDSLEKELLSYGADAKMQRNALLAVEELLLLYKAKLQSDDTDVKIDVIRGTKLFSLKISISAEKFSPDALQEESGVHIFDTIAEKAGFSVSYSYAGNMNQIEIVLKKYFDVIQNFLFSFKYIEQKSTLIFAFVMHIISIVVNLVIPIVTGELIAAYTDSVILQIFITALALLAAKLIYNVTFNIANVFYCRVSYRSETAMRKELIGKMFSIKNAEYDKYGSGTFIQRVTADLQTISNGMTGALDIFSEGVYYIGVLVATALLNFWVFAAELLMLFILFLFERRRAFRLEIDKRKASLVLDRLSGSIVDCINGILEVKLLNAKGTFTKKISSVSDDCSEKLQVANRNSRRWIIIGSCTVAAFAFLIMMLLGYDLYAELITVPTALILFNFFTIIDRPVIALAQRALDFFKQFNLATERVRNLRDGSEFGRENFGNLHKDKLYGDISFSDVTFAYNHDDLGVPDNNILKNISFDIKQGETVAFVGKSGSGKSTLLKLLSRQCACYSGEITIDGCNLSEFDCDTVYDNISIISQSTVLFNCSIRENLLLAKPDATLEELREVCRKACILEDIERTEDGFDTMLGEKGVRFSGGQRQRLAIARALLRGTNILLLDEATSAMDSITQEHISNTIKNIGHTRTVIIVAHRLSTIKSADRIMLVGENRILASGTHEELMCQSDEYRMLYQYESNVAAFDAEDEVPC